MLKKVLKYDLKFIYNNLFVFYSLMLFFALLTRFFSLFDNSTVLNVFEAICSGTTISFGVNILINAIIRLWVRFNNNLYKDESYLTHTLPVSKNTIYKSKFLAALITLISSVLVILLSIFIAYYSKANIENLKNFIEAIFNQNKNIYILIGLVLSLLFTEFLVVIEVGYTGIILGHRKNNNKFLFSILYGFITYIITQIGNVIWILIASVFNKKLWNLFITNTIPSSNIINTVLILALVLWILYLIILYIINLQFFKKGVNVD